MEIVIIAALAKNDAIGYENDLLAYIPADLKRFKALTTGHTIVMGRKTFESLPKGALPNRVNLLLTRNQAYKAEGTVTVSSVQEAVANCGDGHTLFVIGGASIYREFLPLATQLKLTFIHRQFEKADTFFPHVDYTQWTETARTDVNDDPKTEFKYSFVDYTRKNKQ
ncbi:MAG: dihydrofolate reductase [Breznakibacter sp.]